MATLVQIEGYLKKLDLKYTLIDLSGKVFRVEDVVAAGVNPEEIIKTLLVRISDNRFVALVARGRDRVDFKKVRRLFGSKSELAKPDEVRRIVGVPIGAVCPILTNLPVIFDSKVMGLEKVNLGSGDLTQGLEMDLGDLVRAVGQYTICDLT
ncbi:hypothetical protein A3C33_04180 [Candidatus Curtissbacteria bacterium RIFCSPHIGHO2_02_FULL_42_58]|nr:MAG: hypothetical protein A3C33_04180 [Candidatus Curtissbacteria bacterium RIFCSPHIGHO2_02_FULL_42_58]